MLLSISCCQCLGEPCKLLIKWCRIIPCSQNAPHVKLRAITNYMAGMMILIIKNKMMMQTCFDFLDFGPNESVRPLHSLDMKSPLLFTKKVSNTLFRVQGSLPRLSHRSNRARGLAFQLFLPGKNVLAALARAMLLELDSKDSDSSSPAATWP